GGGGGTSVRLEPLRAGSRVGSLVPGPGGENVDAGNPAPPVVPSFLSVSFVDAGVELPAPPAATGALLSISSGPNASFQASAPCFPTQNTPRPATSVSAACTSTIRQYRDHNGWT